MAEDIEAQVPEEVPEEGVKKMIPIDHFRPPEHDTLMDCPGGEVRGIIFYPDKRLREPSQPVTEFAVDGTPMIDPRHESWIHPVDMKYEEWIWSLDINKLVADMAMTMYSVGGMGLSAIQIGVPIRLFICDVLIHEPPDKDGKPKSQLLVALNPEIGWTSSEKIRAIEGCLSFPGVNESIERPAVVGLRGFSRKGKPFALRAGGSLGRAILHEMDHLDGVCFDERMGAMQKKLVSKKMLKFHRGVRKGTLRLKN